VPTYAYACTACDHRLEVKQSFTDAALSDCPECTGRLRKVFSNVGVVFKGSGFYRTDSRKDAKGSSSSSSAPSTSGSSTESGSSSSTAVAPKTTKDSSSSSSTSTSTSTSSSAPSTS
jgi:putative FmdB family regulatory protein